YHQVTDYPGAPRGDYQLEYGDIRSAWRDYLAHYNHGRGVVLIGHSAGSFNLKRLIADEIDPHASERKLIVSAILAGGHLVVANRGRGGDLPAMPPCTARSDTGCVVAWSTFGSTPPKDARFESVDHPATQHVLCVNPTDPRAAGSTPVTPWFPAFQSEGVAP